MTFLIAAAAAVSVASLVFQCSSSNRQSIRKSSEASKKKTGADKKSSKSAKSLSRKKNSKKSFSGKSTRSSEKTKSAKNPIRSRKSIKKDSNQSSSQKKINAAILADRMAAKDAIRPSTPVPENTVTDNQHGGLPISYTKIRVLPHEISFNSVGGLKQAKVKNMTDQPIVFMIKCSDNMLYSINPVYGCVDVNSEATVNILRENGSSKHDKIVLITTARVTDKSPYDVFNEIYNNNSVNYNVNVVPLLTQ